MPLPPGHPNREESSDSASSLQDDRPRPRPSRWERWAEQQAEQQRWHRLREERAAQEAAQREYVAAVRAREEAYYREQRAVVESYQQHAAAAAAVQRPGLQPAYVEARLAGTVSPTAADQALTGSTGETLSSTLSTAEEVIERRDPLLASESTGSTAHTQEGSAAAASGADEHLHLAASIQIPNTTISLTYFEAFPEGVPDEVFDWIVGDDEAAETPAAEAGAVSSEQPPVLPPVPPPAQVSWHDFFEEERLAEQRGVTSRSVYAAPEAAAATGRRLQPSEAPGLTARTRTRGRRGGKRHRFHAQVVESTPQGQRRLDPRETRAAYRALREQGLEPGRLPPGAVGWVRGSLAGPGFLRPDLPDIPHFKGWRQEWEEGGDEEGPPSGNESEDSEDYRHPERGRGARRHKPFIPALHRDDGTADEVAEGVVDARGLQHRDFLPVAYEEVLRAAGLNAADVATDAQRRGGEPDRRPNVVLTPGNRGSSSSSSSQQPASSSNQPSSSSNQPPRSQEWRGGNWQEGRWQEEGQWRDGEWWQDGAWGSQDWQFQPSDRHWPQEDERQRERAPDPYSPEVALEVLEYALSERDCGSFPPVASFDWYGVVWVQDAQRRTTTWNIAALESAREFQRAGWECVITSFASAAGRQREVSSFFDSELPRTAPARYCTDLFKELIIVPDRVGRRGKTAALVNRFGNRVKLHIDDHPLDYYRELHADGIACLGVWNGVSRWQRGLQQWPTVTAAAKVALAIQADHYGPGGPANRLYHA